MNNVMSVHVSKSFGMDHGVLIENLNEDISMIVEKYSRIYPSVIASTITGLGYLYVLMMEDIVVSVTLLGISLLQLIPPLLVEKYMQVNYDDCREIEAKITNHVVEAVKGFEIIKLYNLRNWWLKRLSKLHNTYLSVGRKSDATATAQISLYKMLDNILKYGTYAILGVFVLYHICSTETAVFGIALSASFYSALKTLFSCIPEIAVSRTAEKRLERWAQVELKTDSVQDFNAESNEILVKDVAYGYEETIIKDVHYKFDDQKSYMIVGKNGSGKSTLLNLLTGVLLPKKGIVSLNGIPAEKFTGSLYTKMLLYVPQEDMVFDFSAQDLFEMYDRSYMSRFWELADRFGLSSKEIREKSIRELSGGERKKLYLTIAFSLNPRFLLLDEPTNFLDASAQSVLTELIVERGGGTIIVSHDPMLRDVVDKILIIEGGRVQDEGI